MKIPQNLNKYQLFSLLGAFILSLEFLAIFLTITNFFYWIILASYLLLGIPTITILFWHNRQALKNYPLLFTNLIALITIILFFHFTTPTIFSGRDQGSFSEAAIRLSQNHKLTFNNQSSQAFFKIYGQGVALNFPGFSYTKNGNLTTNFSLGYIAWLAIFYSLFGLYGLVIANGVTFFLFLLSFFFLIELYSSFRSAILAIFLIISSFVFIWLFKFTLSENLALGFIWFGILEITLFLKTKKINYFLLALSSFFLLAFTRIEAWAFIAMLGIIYFIIQKNKHQKANTKKISKLAFGFFLLYLLNIQVNQQFYLASLKGLLRSFSPSEHSSALFSTSNYLFEIFSIYNILPFLIIGIIGIVFFSLKKKCALLVPCLIIVPTFIYIIHPGISLDHPWMLRRFAFTIIPGAIFYTILIIDQFFTKKIYFLLLSILIATNLIISTPYINLQENAELLTQTKQLSNAFSSSDLVLVDRLASGDGWSMLSGPLNFLYGKQAVYFFNPQDLTKIDTNKFSNIYLIIPDENLTFYEKNNFLEKFSFQKKYSITISRLDTFDPENIKKNSLTLPQKVEITTTGKIYILNKA